MTSNKLRLRSYNIVWLGSLRGNISLNTYGVKDNSFSDRDKGRRNRPFADLISSAGYFYMDKFAVLVGDIYMIIINFDFIFILFYRYFFLVIILILYIML